ncbi:MAG: FimV/HubP family polar landmark protein [Lysobacteraceae bacterium]
MKSAGIQHADAARALTAKALSLGVAIVVALATIGQAQAIGLGAIEVKSQLGKPFVAEIPVTLSTPDEAIDLSVRLASPEAFARVGLPPRDLSANLTFTLIKNASGQTVIRITTPQPMTDPYVSFLLEANWGRGKMVREYTALLDPPRTTAVRRVPMSAPVVQSTPLPRPMPMPPPPVTQPSVAPMPAPPPLVARNPVPPPAAPPQLAPRPPAPPPPAPGSILDVPPTEPAMAERPKPIPLRPPPPLAAPPPPIAVQPMPQSEPEMEALPPPEPPEPLVQAPPPQPMQSFDPMPQAMPEPTPPPVEPMPMPAAGPDSYTVMRGDTLSRVATQTRPDVSLNRMMIALQRANPDAFISQNINLLKSGSVLRIPPNEEAQTLSADESNLLVQQQVESWRQASRPQLQARVDTASSKAGVIDQVADVAEQPAEVEPKPAAKAKAKVAVAKAEPSKIDSSDSASAPSAKKTKSAQVAQAHLEIVAPTGKGARSNQTGASEGGSGSELRAELAQTKENLAARTAEIGELKSRLSDLEKMQQNNQTLLSMKDSKLAEMQQRLAELESKQPNGAAATASVDPSGTTGAAEAAAGTASLDSNTLATASTDSAAATTPPPTTDTTAIPASSTTATSTPPAATTSETSVETPWYLRPLVLIGGGLLLLGGLLALLLRGKRPAEPMPGRYNASALAASIESARNGDADSEQPEYEDDLEPFDDEAAHSPVADPVVAPGAAVADVERGARPYWTSAYDVDSTRAQPEPTVQEAELDADPVLDETPIVEPVQPAPMVETVQTEAPVAWTPEAVAPTAVAEDDWDLEADAISATTTTAQHAAVDDFDTEDQSVATKIELARAYIDIGDMEGARGMLEEVLMEGTDHQRDDAFKLLETLD